MGRIIKGHCAQERIEWEQAICSVCLEAPHKAVLLLCSSYDKGCRPYMCGTNFRHSDCLNLFKKAYTKPSLKDQVPNSSPFTKKSEPSELSCPLCRGQVKGWTVVEPARRHLDEKKRTCMHDECTFVGKFKELKRHVKHVHRLAKARKVDPVLEAEWRAFESRREQQDVISSIRSSMPRSVVMGDYVIDMDGGGSDDIVDFDPDEDDLLDEEDGGFLGRMGSGRNLGRRFLFYLLHNGARFSRVLRDGGGRRRQRRRQGRTLWG